LKTEDIPDLEFDGTDGNTSKNLSINEQVKGADGMVMIETEEKDRNLST
jgi:hypothetical protein